MSASTPAAAVPRAPLRTLDDAMAELLAHAQPLAGHELLDTFDADGRVLAQDLVAALQVPPFDNSAMDGYALRFADLPGPLRVVGESAAGAPFPAAIGAGEACRIFTGAEVPAGADTVAVQ